MAGKDQLLWKYAGLATQLLVMLGLAVWGGLWLDKKLHFSTPLLVWILPLVLLTVLIIKIIKDTSKSKD